MDENLEKRSAAAIGRLIAKGKLDPVEVAEFFLDRIERDRENPSFILVTRERALAEAAESRKRRREGRPAGPLDGVPIAWKDLVDMAGERTTAGSALFAKSAPKQEDAPIVANLSAAGMVALGKTNLSEFAFSALGLNPHFGTPRNPRDPATPRIEFTHLSGWTAGMEVAWTFAPIEGGTRVTIEHELDFRRIPVLGPWIGRRIIGDFFIQSIAGKTLARMKELAEATT